MLRFLGEHSLRAAIYLGQQCPPADSLALCPRPLGLLGSAAPRSPWGPPLLLKLLRKTSLRGLHPQSEGPQVQAARSQCPRLSRAGPGFPQP